MNNNKFVSIKEASEILGVDKTTLRRWDKTGKLKPVRNPLNKYRQYKKEDVIKLAQELNKIPSDKIEFYINNYCQFVNKNIHKLLFKDYSSKEIMALISNRGEPQDTFMKVHFLKTYHLLLSIFRLCSPVLGMPFPDEANILLRSLFEHIANFLYIYSQDSHKKINNLIHRFFDYGINVAQHKYAIDYYNDMQEYSNIDDKGIKILNNEVQEYLKKHKVIDSLGKYKQLYQTKNTNTWHGLNTRDFFKQIYNNLPCGKTFIFYKKFYTDANAYVHCNLMDYVNEEGIIVGNVHKEDALKVAHHSVLMTLGYMEGFFNLIGVNIREKYTKIFEDFDILCTNYYNFIGEIKTND